MTGKLNVMNRSGHTTTTWCIDLEETVKEANEQFNALLGMGYTAFAMSGTTTGEQIVTFDPEQEQIIMVPRMVGG